MPWRGSDGSVAGGSYESWIEKQIRDAQDRGEFDDLPGAGEPLKSSGSDPDWWIKGVIRREGLDMSAAMPPGLALRKRAQELPDMVLRERSEQAVRDLVEDFNVQVRDYWMGSHDGPTVFVRTIDVDEQVERWSAHRERREGSRAAGESAATLEQSPADSAPPGWWRRIRGLFRH